MVGNFSNYTKIDVLRVFLNIKENIAREELCRKLELGEGTLKSILNILKNGGLIASTKQGHSMSKKGKVSLDLLLKDFSLPMKFESDVVFPEFIKVGICVKNYIKNLPSSYILRDVALKNGAEGALIFHYDEKLVLLDTKHELNFDFLIEFFNLNEKDLLIISFGKTLRWAEIGTLYSGMEICPALRKFVEKF